MRNGYFIDIQGGPKKRHKWPNCNFCISRGSVVTTLKGGDQNYTVHTFASSFFLMLHAKNYRNQPMFFRSY